MATIDALMQEGHNRMLRRHGGLKQIMYLAPASTAAPASILGTTISDIIDPEDLGFFPIGLVTDEGTNFEDTFEVEGTSSVGYMMNTREDVASVTQSISVTLQESYNRLVEQVVRGADYTANSMTAKGEVVFNNPGVPVFKEYRGLVLSVDGPADDQWIMGEFFYSLKLSARDAKAWAKGTTIDRPVTFTALPDATTGIPSDSFVAGTGPLKHAAALGFTPASS